MATALSFERGWSTAETGRSTFLLVRLRQRSCVLPWALFLYAEGNDTEMRVVFHTHVITVQGSGLGALLSELGNQVVSELIEPDRTSKFGVLPGAQITALALAENK